MGGVRLGGTAFTEPGFVPFFDGGDDGDLYIVPFTGPPATLLKAGALYQPVASPDYSQVAYLDGGSNFGDLRVINRDGSGDALVKAGDLRWPDWHPDGSHILYGDYSNDTEVRRIDPDGSNDTLIFDATVPGQANSFVHRAVYNHDGTKIAFIRGNQTTPPSSAPADQLIVIDADGSNDVVVATLDNIATFGENAVAWMHGSDVLAYQKSSGGGTTTDHFRVDADGSNTTLLAVGDGTDMIHRRCFSLDDQTFYFIMFDNSGGHYTLWKAAADGSEAGGGEAQVSPAFGIFRPPPLVFANGRIYADGEDVPATTTLGLHSILEDGSDYRVEYGATSVRLESHV